MSTREEIQNLYQQYVMSTYASASLALVRGKGAYVWDSEGKRYLDFLAGISVMNVGHCHPKVVKALRKQAGQLIHVSNLYHNENQPRLAQALVERSLKGGKCFFCNSGAEANEGLIKLARLWGSGQGRYEVITMRNSFHGRTLATLTATGQEKVQKGFHPLPEGFVYADFNNLDSVRSAISGKTAAVLVEAVQGEGGIMPATDEFMKGLRALCDEKNILLLVDEVQAGMGRTGTWFAWQHYGIEPDAFSLAKALGSGYPLGAVVAGPKVADVFQPGHHASTFGGTPLACAAGLAVVETIEEEGLLENVRKMGDMFRSELEKLVPKYKWIQCVRGRGLMIGLVLNCPAKDLQMSMQEQGLLALATANTIIRFLPPLNIDEKIVKRAASIIRKACRSFDKQAGVNKQ